jgi:hypothetical protein
MGVNKNNVVWSGNWIYWSLLLQALVITINYNNSLFSRTLLPRLPRIRSILNLSALSILMWSLLYSHLNWTTIGSILICLLWICSLFWTVLSESESESELLYDWRFTANQFVLATSPLRLTTSNFIFQLNTCCYSPYVTSSLTRGWVCRLQLLLVFANVVVLRYESRGAHGRILLSQIWDCPNLQGHVPVFISPRNIVACLYLQALDSLS